MPRAGDIPGYAGASAADRDLSGRKDRLIRHGAVRAFGDVISGRTFRRPGPVAPLDRALSSAGKSVSRAAKHPGTGGSTACKAPGNATRLPAFMFRAPLAWFHEETFRWGLVRAYSGRVATTTAYRAGSTARTMPRQSASSRRPASWPPSGRSVTDGKAAETLRIVRRLRPGTVVTYDDVSQGVFGDTRAGRAAGAVIRAETRNAERDGATG